MPPSQLIRAFDLAVLLCFVLAGVGSVTFLRLRKRKSWTFLVFFTTFFAYLAKAIDETVLRFQSLLFLRHFLPNLMVRGQAVGNSLQSLPLLTLTAKDVTTSFLNVLLFVPFGFGLPFITPFRAGKVVACGAFFNLTIELLQLTTGLLAKTTFRVADVNDLIFNTLGTAIGYLLFLAFLWVYRRIFARERRPLNAFLRYIAERPQING